MTAVLFVLAVAVVVALHGPVSRYCESCRHDRANAEAIRRKFRGGR